MEPLVPAEETRSAQEHRTGERATPRNRRPGTRQGRREAPEVVGSQEVKVEEEVQSVEFRPPLVLPDVSPLRRSPSRPLPSGTAGTRHHRSTSRHRTVPGGRVGRTGTTPATTRHHRLQPRKFDPGRRRAPRHIKPHGKYLVRDSSLITPSHANT